MIVNPDDSLDVQVEKQAKIISALMKRAQRQTDVGQSAFQAFQSALELKKKVVDQSRDLERAAHDLESAQYERERIRRALTGALSSMQESFALFSDGQLDVFNDQLGRVLPDIAERLQIGLPLNAFFDCLWHSRRFVSCDRSLTEVKAKAIGTLQVETTLSAVVELKDDLWYQLNIQHVAPDSLVLLLTQITDLIRRNRAEKDSLIDRQADYLKAVFQNISSGLCTFSADDTVMMYNERFREALGLPEHVLAAPTQMRAVLSHLLASGVLRQDQADEVDKWQLELRTKGRFEHRVRFAGEQVFDVQANMLPDGGYVIELKDVTLEARNQELLENRVMERTAELTRANEQLIREYDEKARVEEELRVAKERAEAAVSSKTRFLAAASHDLLQPINAAKLLISTLRQTTESTVHAPMVKRLDGAFGSAEQLLHSLVDLSRLESPEPDAVSPGEVALAPLMEGVHADQTLVAQQKGVVLDMVPCSAFVRSDPVYLLRSVQNLVVNAIQYTEPGGRVLFGCRRHRDQITLEVWDTGVGIALKDQRKIFDEFARVGNTQMSMGLGLGLSVVDRACRLLGHNLRVRSAPGRGSVFSITMDVEHRARPATDLRVDVAHSPTAALDYIFLVIENDASVLESMTLWLEHRGGSVLPARSVEEARTLAQEIGMPPDAILADYQLDGLETGVDAIRTIRALYQTNIPAVLITANRNKSLWREGAENDISVLAKPVKLAPLHTLVERKIHQFREAARVGVGIQTKVDGDA